MVTPEKGRAGQEEARSLSCGSRWIKSSCSAPSQLFLLQITLRQPQTLRRTPRRRHPCVALLCDTPGSPENAEASAVSALKKLTAQLGANVREQNIT